MDKELRKVLKELERQGFETRTTKKSRVAVYLDGEFVAVFGTTSGDHRSLRNGIAYARRAGFEWPPKR